MKKRIVLFVLISVLFSTSVFAVSYGAKIQRIQTFPGEKIKGEIDIAKESIGEPDETQRQLTELSRLVSDVKVEIDKLSADMNNARTEVTVQMSNLLTGVANVKSQIEEFRELKLLRDELPPLLEQPREIITPKLLINLSIVNIVLLFVLIGLVLFVRRDHDATHKMVPHGHPELHDYIRQHIKKGVHINTIRHQLLSHDWDSDEVDQAIREVRET